MPGKLRTLDIYLDNPAGVYFAGTAVSGTIFIDLAEPMKVRGVHLALFGRAWVHWTEQEGAGENQRTVSYNAQETYINQDAVLWGQPKSYNGEIPLMAPGQHRFQFQFPLPANCPTSYEGMHGNIRYLMTVRLDKPWKFDHVAKRAFTVLGLVDLNTTPNAGNPVRNTGSKTLGVLCCQSGVISATTTLPKVGYVAGEFIPAEVQTSNNSTRKMKRVEVKIIETVVFQAHTPWRKTRSHTKTVAQVVQLDEMAEGESKTFQFPNLRIPPVPPILPTCSIIRIAYSVIAEFVPHGPSFSLDVGCPIIIGTIPLRTQFAMIRPAAPPPTQPMMGGGNVVPSAPPVMPKSLTDEYPDLPPPSYEESVFGRTNIREKGDTEHTRGQLDFAPKYLYYNTASAEVAPPRPT